jgi:hypothetical protein
MHPSPEQKEEDENKRSLISDQFIVAAVQTTTKTTRGVQILQKRCL